MKTRAFLLALPLLALGAAGCVDNRASLQIQQICAPPKTCEFSAGKCDTIALGNPIIDPSVTSYLTLILQLENQLPDNTSADIKKVNTNDAHVNEAVVEYSGAMSGKVTFGVVADVPAASTQLVDLDIIPSAVGLPAGQAWPLYDVVGAKLRLRGYYDDGSHFETGDFQVDIWVSTGAAVANCANACPHAGQWPASCP